MNVHEKMCGLAWMLQLEMADAQACKSSDTQIMAQI
jgi:hypothetical protein